MEACMKQLPFRICKPLFITMNLFGLFHVPCKGWIATKWVSKFSKMYSSVVLFLLWLNFLRFFFAYSRDDSFDPALFYKIVTHIWYLMCAVNCAVNFKACFRDTRLREFLTRWLELTKINRNSCPGIAQEYSNRSYKIYMSRRVIAVLVIGWMMFLFNFLVQGYLMFVTTLADNTIAPMSPNHRYASHVKAILLAFHTFATASWGFTLCLFFLISSVIYREFEIFHQDFRAAISADGEIHCGIEGFRRRHQAICRIVETADDTLSLFNLTGIGFSLCIAMLVLYNIISYEVLLSDTLALLSNIFWIVASFAYLFIIAFGAGYLNHMAHAPLKSIHDVRVDKTSPEFSLQMNIFLNKLSGEPIGLTALDLFVIDKPTILTIAGAFITYFIVLIQFKQPSGSTNGISTCNCTDVLLNSTLQCSTLL